MEKTRRGYLEIARKYSDRIKIIDAEKTPNEVYQDLKIQLEQVIDLGGE